MEGQLLVIILVQTATDVSRLYINNIKTFYCYCIQYCVTLDRNYNRGVSISISERI